MPDEPQNIRISQITLATHKMESMQIFYNVVFGAKFRKYDLQDEEIFEGSLGGIRFTLVPAHLLGIEKGPNSFQLDINVPDVGKWVEVAIAFGGKYDGNEGIVTVDGKTFASMLDPDGNSITIMQAYDDTAADDAIDFVVS